MSDTSFDPLLGRASARTRVIIDNDFSGDPDDLFQLAHHVLSPSVEVALVIGSHLRPGDPFDPSTTQAANAARIARETLAVLERPDIPVEVGAELALTNYESPYDSAAARAIVAEALRDDPRPLYYCAGAGLTDLASALMLNPQIADRMTLVWIGGGEYPELASPPPNAMPIEYNQLIDPLSVRFVFEQTSIAVQQFPRDTYRRALVSYAELDARIAPHGALGAYLHHSIARLVAMTAEFGLPIGETYCMGDSPLVLATALTSAFEPDASSSRWVNMPRPRLRDDGGYGDPVPSGGSIRVYTEIDSRLLFEDLFAKVRTFAERSL